MKDIIRTVRIGLIVSTVTLAIILLLMYWGFTLQTFKLLGILATASIAVFAFMLAIIPDIRWGALKTAIICAMIFAALYASVPLGKHARYMGLKALARRSEPLIEQIKRYVSEKKKYPKSLEILVPEYIDKVPWTGMPACPEYYMRLNQRMRGIHAWELGIICPQGPLGYDDRFFYWPTEKYPDSTEIGYIQRIENWAYHHMAD